MPTLRRSIFGFDVKNSTVTACSSSPLAKVDSERRSRRQHRIEGTSVRYERAITGDRPKSNAATSKELRRASPDRTNEVHRRGEAPSSKPRSTPSSKPRSIDRARPRRRSLECVRRRATESDDVRSERRSRCPATMTFARSRTRRGSFVRSETRRVRDARTNRSIGEARRGSSMKAGRVRDARTDEG